MAEYFEDEKLKLSYLFSISRSAGCPEALKSIFAHLGATTADWCNLTIGKNFGTKLGTCQYCCVQRNADNASYKILPTVRPGASMRRILSKSKNNKRLSTIEKKLLLRRHTGNTLVITCLVCHKTTKLRYHKPAQENEQDKLTNPAIVRKKNIQKKRKTTPLLDWASTPEVKLHSSPATTFPGNCIQSDCEVIAEVPAFSAPRTSLSKVKKNSRKEAALFHSPILNFAPENHSESDCELASKAPLYHVAGSLISKRAIKKIKKKAKPVASFNSTPSTQNNNSSSGLATSFPEKFSPRDCEISDPPLCEVSNSLNPRKTTLFAENEDFIPIEGNLTKRKLEEPRNKNIFVNPFAVKKSRGISSVNNVKRRKISALQQIMEKEQKANQRNSPRLKDFLNVL